MAHAINLQAIGDDWFLLGPPEDSLDTVDAPDYAAILAGEPGVSVATTVGSKKPTSATTPSPAGLRLHLTHIPLLGGREALQPHPNVLAAPRLPLQEANPDWWAELRPYQAQTASWAASRHGSIIAHDLGLGKTRTALAASQVPLLVLCPKTAISVWKDECTYAGLQCTTLEGHPPSYAEVVDFFKEKIPVTDVWLMNYHVAEYWVRYFSLRGPLQGIHTIICDEAHYLQKERLTWTQTINGIQRERCILLTATPLRNRLVSLWSLLNTACPHSFGKVYDFRKTYCGAHDGGYGLVDGDRQWQQSLAGKAALARLQLRLGEVVNKLTRAQAGHEVPPLERKAHYVTVPQSLLNKTLDASTEATARLQGGAGTTVAWYTDLRQRIGLLKVPEAARLTASLLPQWKRAVLWVWHDDVVSELKAQLRTLLPGDIIIDEILGKTSQKKRDATARAWKATKDTSIDAMDSRILIVSLGAGSQAVSYTTAGLAIFVELDWAPLQMQQGEKRTHRFGQIHDSCLTLYCVLKNTIDETVADVLLEKAQECEEILGVDGQVDQMQTLFGVAATVEKESNTDFMQRIAERLLAAQQQEAW